MALTPAVWRLSLRYRSLSMYRFSLLQPEWAHLRYCTILCQ